ncbi:MAG: hypothetical protein IKL82_00225 [Clostridia bacterium]|nr:hypothetical protein [Clostridia bacterium]
MLSDKRIIILSGHYGSGKTNVAVNLSLSAKKDYEKVTLADLDIVNPYFRSKDSELELEKNGVRLICSPYANSNVDIPALPQEIYAVTDDKTSKTFVDVGGDDRGALALGRLTPEILKENSYEMLLVVNSFRPLTPTPESAVEVAREIENACKLKFTGVINNSNLGEFTTEADVLGSVDYASGVARILGVPVVLTTVSSKLYGALKDKIENLYPLVLQKKI